MADPSIPPMRPIITRAASRGNTRKGCRVALPLPDKAYLLECFDADLEAGRLIWRVRPKYHFSSERGWRVSDGKCSGQEAGWARLHPKTGKWRWFIRLNGKEVPRSRIIFFLVSGLQPPEVDHRDGNTLNDRADNLRASDRLTNAANLRLRRGKKSGLPKGVTPHKGGFAAQICARGVHYYIGRYVTVEEAHAAYCEAAKLHFGEFWCAG